MKTVVIWNSSFTMQSWNSLSKCLSEPKRYSIIACLTSLSSDTARPSTIISENSDPIFSIVVDDQQRRRRQLATDFTCIILHTISQYLRCFLSSLTFMQRWVTCVNGKSVLEIEIFTMCVCLCVCAVAIATSTHIFTYRCMKWNKLQFHHPTLVNVPHFYLLPIITGHAMTWNNHACEYNYSISMRVILLGAKTIFVFIFHFGISFHFATWNDRIIEQPECMLRSNPYIYRTYWCSYHRMILSIAITKAREKRKFRWNTHAISRKLIRILLSVY